MAKIIAGSGPSAEQYWGATVDIVCNTGFLHFKTKYVMAVDDRAYTHIRNTYKLEPGTQLWCRRKMTFGTPIKLDSGSASVMLAQHLWPGETCIMFGFDGILDPTNKSANRTNYNWPWKEGSRERPIVTRTRHRTSLLAHKQNILLVSDTTDSEFDTITHREFKKILDKS